MLEPDKESTVTLGALDRAMRPIEDAANLIAAIAIFLLMLLGSTQIVMRSVFNKPISGYIDLVELSMAGMAFLGAAYCQRLGAHIRMEILIGAFKGRMLWAFEIFGTLVALFVIGVLFWYSWEHFLRSYQLGDTTIDAQFPVWPSKLLVPIAFAIWWVRLAVQLAGSIRLFVNPSVEPIAVATIHDVASVAQDEIEETFGEAVENIAKEVNQSEINQSEINQSEINQSEINQSEINQRDVNQSEVDQRDVSQGKDFR